MLKKTDKSLIKFFGQRWKKFDQEPIITELKKIYDIYFENFPFDKINSLKNGADWINSNGEVISNSILTSENSLPHKYAFCSDTSYAASLIEKINEVDLLYHETTFMKDLEDRAEKTGHSTTLQAATIAKKAKVKRLLIGHYSQRYKNLDDLLEETKEIFSNSYLSSSGLVVDFKEI